ncbi:MAG: glycosyl transferase [Frankiales bacterium]|nr:glycosyl transferase [Frankiales bacterium]
MHLALLVDALRRGGDEVEVFTRPPRERAARLLDAWDPLARRALAAAVARFRPDVVHAHNVVRELSVSVLGAAPAVPLVLTAHDGRLLGDADGRGTALRAYQRGRAAVDATFARRHADLVLAVSGPLAARFRGAGFTAVEHTAPWAAAPVAPLVPAQDCRDLVFVGRLGADKGVHVLLEALAGVPGGRLLLAGSGDDLTGSPLVREGRAVLLGTLDRTAVSQLLAGARAVVLPSLPSRRPEGSPLVLAEALVHGRPIVVSDDPGSVELTRDGRCGLVTPAGDVAALAAALRSVVEDDALVADLSAQATAVAPHHGEAAGLARVRAAYERVSP